MGDTELQFFFRKLNKEEAKQKRIPSIYNFIYSKKDSLIFLGYKIENLLLGVKDNIIHRVYFEIPYSNFKIFQDLINEYGYPGIVGTLPANIDFTKPETIEFEKSRKFTWGLEKNKDCALHITNIIDENFQINNTTRLKVKFRYYNQTD